MFNKKKLAAIACALSATLVLSGCAALPYDQRSYDPGYGHSGYGQTRDDHYVPAPIDDGTGVVRCESIKGRSQECRANGRARLIRQLSDTPCVEGTSWGQGRNGVWVAGGCRAEFIVEGRQRRH